MDKSLRCLMKNCSDFTHGFPLELVATALKEVLKALDHIHQQSHLHRELNAGHIYYTLYKPTIKIGFLATVYEPNAGYDGVDQQEYLPVSQICEWGAAPEIYHMTREYLVKSDVWLFGITAIELAFGSIEVKNRGELEMLINEVCENEDGSRRGKGKKVVVMGKYLKKMARKMRIGISGGGGSSSKRLSESLKDMLTKCLIVNAEDRPTAAALLQHDFFKVCDDDSSIDIYNFKKALESAITE